MTPKTPPGGWWRGSGPPGDPVTQRFTAVLASAECAGCLFERNNAATCRQAGEIAAPLGLPIARPVHQVARPRIKST